VPRDRDVGECARADGHRRTDPRRLSNARRVTVGSKAGATPTAAAAGTDCDWCDRRRGPLSGRTPRILAVGHLGWIPTFRDFVSKSTTTGSSFGSRRVGRHALARLRGAAW
jgi:hypothetical protein